MNRRWELERALRAPFETPRRSYASGALILAAFPKSGSTWLRFMIANIVRLTTGNPTDVDFHSLGRYAPDLRRDRRPNRMFPAGPLPRFLKTHSGYVRGFEPCPGILLVRNPDAVMPSYHRHLTRAAGKRFKDMATFLHHWRYGVRAWAAFCRSWMHRCRLILRYEDLEADPAGSLRALYKMAGVALSPEIVDSAVAASSRESMAALLAERGDPYVRLGGFDFAAKTTTALTPDEQAYVRSEGHDVMAWLGY